MTLGERITTAREAKSLSQGDLARRLGVTRAAVSQWESGETMPKQKNVSALSTELEVNYLWLVDGTGSPFGSGLAVHGKVAAGVWNEPGVMQPDIRIPIAPDPDYPADSQFALIVEGTSVNRVAPHGFYLHCVDVEKAALSIRDHDLVVVERRDAGKVETTVKRLTCSNGSWELHPESDDPQWQERIPYDDIEHADVAIRAVVIGQYGPIPRGR